LTKVCNIVGHVTKAIWQIVLILHTCIFFLTSERQVLQI